MENTLKRQSRLDAAGYVVGNPTYKGVERLTNEALLDYENAVDTQIRNERKPTERRVIALTKAKQKIEKVVEQRIS